MSHPANDHFYETLQEAQEEFDKSIKQLIKDHPDNKVVEE